MKKLILSCLMLTGATYTSSSSQRKPITPQQALQEVQELQRTCPFTEENKPKFREMLETTDIKNPHDHRNIINLMYLKELKNAENTKESFSSFINEGTLLMPSPLELAAIKKDPKQTRLLLALGANVNHKNDNGWTALHRAATIDSNELVIQELIKSKADVNIKDKGNQTPLHKAAHNSSIANAQVLLRAGANVNAKTIHGENPLYFAGLMSATEVGLFLIKSGAEALPSKSGLSGITIPAQDQTKSLKFSTAIKKRDEAGIILATQLPPKFRDFLARKRIKNQMQE